jgi:hypothetical protein
MIPRDQSGEHAQDSEPFLAVNKDPADARASLMVGAAFRGPNQPAGATPLILLSNDGGRTWKSKSMLSANQIAAQTYCFSGKEKSFYGSLMTIDGSERTVSVFHTEDPETAEALKDISTLSSGAEFGDAPFIQAHAFGKAPAAGEQESRSDRIYVGQNYFGFPGQQKNRTASIRVSVDNGDHFKLFGIEARDTGNVGQDGPAVRPAIADDGTVYAAFLHWSAKEAKGVRGDVVITRDDQWAADSNPFRALVDPTDGLPGRIVSPNALFSFERLGEQRIVSPLSLAVHPRRSDFVYVAWGDYDEGNKTHVLHVKRSTDKGQNWSEDLLSIPSATNPALAVSEVGVVGFLYQQRVNDKSKGSERWETHFRSSTDGGANWSDVPLATFPTAVEPKSESDPYLGYRSHLVSVWWNFYGIFSAPNLPNQKYFPQGVAFQRNYRKDQLLSSDGAQDVATSIDPYFFRINLTPRDLGSAQAPFTSGTNTAWWEGASRYVVLLAVLVGVLLSLFAIVHARRLFKASEEVYGPVLINYSGYVILRFTDFAGFPIELNSSISAFRLIVKFANKLSEGESGEEINLGGGKDAPEVVFTIVMDSIDYEGKPDHITDKVPAHGTCEFTFDLRRSEPGDGQSLFVQIYQKTQLVQVVSPRSVGTLRNSASL